MFLLPGAGILTIQCNVVVNLSVNQHSAALLQELLCHWIKLWITMAQHRTSIGKYMFVKRKFICYRM